MIRFSDRHAGMVGMAGKFHVNSAGVVSRCRAAQGKCPYGASSHSDTPEGARRIFEKSMSENMGGSLSTVSRVSQGQKKTVNNVKGGHAVFHGFSKTPSSPETIRSYNAAKSFRLEKSGSVFSAIEDRKTARNSSTGTARAFSVVKAFRMA